MGRKGETNRSGFPFRTSWSGLGFLSSPFFQGFPSFLPLFALHSAEYSRFPPVSLWILDWARVPRPDESGGVPGESRLLQSCGQHGDIHFPCPLFTPD